MIKVGDKVYSDDCGFIEGFISEIVDTPLHPLVKFRAIIKAKIKANEMGVEYISDKSISTSSFHINPLVTSNRGWMVHLVKCYSLLHQRVFHNLKQITIIICLSIICQEQSIIKCKNPVVFLLFIYYRDCNLHSSKVFWCRYLFESFF